MRSTPTGPRRAAGAPAADAGAAASAARRGSPKRLVPLIVATALFMENLDSTIIATALPDIARSLHEDPLALSVAISGYLLSLSIFIPLSGWMADRYGARNVFRNAILLFVLGSLCCAASQNVLELVAARVLQGFGGAMMVPVGRLVLLRQVPKSDLVQAMSYLTIPALMAPILGPPVGGFIVTYASWHWIFLINLPIGVLGYWLVSRYIREIREPMPPSLDLAGWMLLGGGVAGLAFGFENIGKPVLPPAVPPVAMAVGAVLSLLYVFHARIDPMPIIRLSLLRIATFRTAVGGGSLYRLGVGSYTFLLPMMLQLGFGYTPLQSGLTTFAGAVGALAMKTIAPRVTRRCGFRRLLVANTFVCSAALIAIGWIRPGTPYLLTISLLLVGGFLRSLQFTCINAMAYADIDEPSMSQATSFSSTAQQLALSVGVGVGSQLLNASRAIRHAQNVEVTDFTVAFCVVALVSLLPVLSFRRLAHDAGSSVSGHRLALANEPTTPAPQ